VDHESATLHNLGALVLEMAAMLEKLLLKTLQALQSYLGLRLLLPVSSSQVHRTFNLKCVLLSLDLAVQLPLLVLKLLLLKLRKQLKGVQVPMCVWVNLKEAQA
jgi:hypothetical protein